MKKSTGPLSRQIAEKIARATMSRRGFLSKTGKWIVGFTAAISANVAMSDVAQASANCCSLAGYQLGFCGSSLCTAAGGCGGSMFPDTTFHSPGNCWTNGAGYQCCDCYGVNTCGRWYCICTNGSKTNCSAKLAEKGKAHAQPVGGVANLDCINETNVDVHRTA